MKRIRRGFTLIEVSLFLAVSAALFLGVTVGVQNSIKQQRFNDSVQNFAEFLRTVYSEALNVQHAGIGNGRSERAIYGKLITFGEERNLSGEQNTKNLVFTYQVTAGAESNSAGSDALGHLKGMDAKVMVNTDDDFNEVNSYLAKWGAAIQKPNFQPFKGMILIVRHPKSGMVYTYYSDDLLEINKDDSTREGFLDQVTWHDNSDPIDFCINPSPTQRTPLRGDVRITSDTRNSSGVILIGETAEDTADGVKGNQCNT